MSTTIAARPIRTVVAIRRNPPDSIDGRACVSGTTNSSTSLCVDGYSRANDAVVTASAARASSIDTPALSRPSTLNRRADRSSKTDCAERRRVSREGVDHPRGHVRGYAHQRLGAKTARRYADDREGSAVHPHRPSDDGWIPAETRLPVLVRKNDDRRVAAGAALVRTNQATGGRGDAEHREIVVGDEMDGDPFRRTVHRQRSRPHADSRLRRRAPAFARDSPGGPGTTGRERQCGC